MTHNLQRFYSLYDSAAPPALLCWSNHCTRSFLVPHLSTFMRSVCVHRNRRKCSLLQCFKKWRPIALFSCFLRLQSFPRGLENVTGENFFFFIRISLIVSCQLVWLQYRLCINNHLCFQFWFSIKRVSSGSVSFTCSEALNFSANWKMKGKEKKNLKKSFAFGWYSRPVGVAWPERPLEDSMLVDEQSNHGGTGSFLIGFKENSKSWATCSYESGEIISESQEKHFSFMWSKDEKSLTTKNAFIDVQNL